MDDLDACTSILEHHDWNLQEAVQYTLEMMEPPQQAHVDNIFDAINRESPPPAYDTVGMPAEASCSSGPVSSNGGRGYAVFDLPPSHATPSDSPVHSRLLSFKVEYRQQDIPVVLQDTNPVGKIKEHISQILPDVPINMMKLHGWIHKNDELVKDTDILRDLKLPKENTLYLLTPELPQDCSSRESSSLASMQELAKRTYELDIFFVEQDKRLTVKFPGSKTIGQVKEDLVNLAGPVRYQIWNGWPSSDESATLATCGINYPSHRFELRSSSGTSKVSGASVKSEGGHAVRQPEDSMDAESDYDDAADNVHYDDMVDDDVHTSACQPLMPDTVEDQTAAAEHFCREFSARYGETHPVFYFGSLDDALREALLCPARERKLLAIYLHHDQSIFANVFCSQILCADTMVEFLCTNFITWAWDLSNDANREILLGLCTRHFGSVAANTVRFFRPDELPLLLVISRNRGSNEVVQILHGNSTLDEIMVNLMQTVEVFKGQLSRDITEEDERCARERVLQEQDAAYRESLEADRAKAMLRKQVEEEQQRRENEEQEKLEKEKMQQEEEQAVKEALRQSMEDQLPAEPPSSCSEPVTLIRIRCPDGKVLNRRFFATDTLRTLFLFIGSSGYHINSYKVLTTYPRRDLMQTDTSLTLNELKLCPQETLTLEEL